MDTDRHTTSELTEGARVAWRNHARCIGRLHWRSLRVTDRRDAHTAQHVFEACVDHLRRATNGGRIRPVLTVFAPSGGDGDEIRIWNPQLIRYAGYRMPDGSIVGDPLHVELTEAVRALGWPGGGGRFDVLPLVVQMPGEPPRWFDLPADAVLEVPLSHPRLPWFTELGLRWHALPVISDMCLEIDGVRYPACPFNGWYVSFEIGARNLTDRDRYNVLPEVMAAMDLDAHDPLAADRALLEVNAAVLHSFRAAGVRIVDHHTAARQFVLHEQREQLAGRVTPAEWAWMVPPISGSLTETFHRVYENPDLRPNFLRQPSAW